MNGSSLPELLARLALSLGYDQDTQRAFSAVSSIPDEDFMAMLREATDLSDPIVEIFREDTMPYMIESVERRRAVGLPVPAKLSRSIDVIQQQLDRLRRVTVQGRR
jgi:hypothetical protein